MSEARGGDTLQHRLIAGRERAYFHSFFNARLYNVAGMTDDDIDQYAATYAAPGALRAGLDPNDLKLLTAAFVFAALILPGLLGRRVRA